MNRPGEERGLLVDLGHERPRLSANARNLSPIVPRGSVAGRALVAVVASMTCLASMTTGAVLLVSGSAAEWQSEVASEITIQVRPAAGRDIDRDAAYRLGLSAALAHDQVFRNQSVGKTCSSAASGPRL